MIEQAGTASPSPSGDVALPGIMGAMMGAVVTASCLLGPFGFVEAMRAVRSH